MARRASPLPEPLAAAVRRFAAWRTSRTSRRIPADLWRLAAELGAHYGVSCTARALRVQYYDLKKRVEAPCETAAADQEGFGEPAPPPAFVEILTTPSADASECVVVFESPSGAKMRIEGKGAGSPDLAALARLFLEPRP